MSECLKTGHNFKACGSEYKPTGKRFLLKRCCGQRMSKVADIVISKCSPCNETRRHTWGMNAVCNICGRRTCVLTPYG